MRTTPGKDENGFGIPAEETDQKAIKTSMSRRLRSFVEMSLNVIIFVGIIAFVVLYVGNKSLTTARGGVADGKQSAVGSSDAANDELPENANAKPEIANIPSDDQSDEDLPKMSAVDIEEKKSLIAQNKELSIKIEKLTGQLSEVHKVYQKRLVELKNRINNSTAESAVPAKQKSPAGMQKTAVMKQQQDRNKVLVNENKVLISNNKELVRRIDVLTKQLDKANKVYLKRLAAMENRPDTSAAENVVALEQQAVAEKHEPSVSEQQQSRKPEFENENKILVLQNKKLERRIDILADQLDKANKVYRKRLAALKGQPGDLEVEKDVALKQQASALEEETAGNDRQLEVNEVILNKNKALVSKNAELVHIIKALDEELDSTSEAYKKLLAEVKNQAGDSATESSAPLEMQAAGLEQEVGDKEQPQNQNDEFVNANVALVNKINELTSVIEILSEQLYMANESQQQLLEELKKQNDKTNKVYNQHSVEHQGAKSKVAAERVRATVKKEQSAEQAGASKKRVETSKKPVGVPRKDTSVAELLSNVKPAANDR